MKNWCGLRQRGSICLEAAIVLSTTLVAAALILPVLAQAPTNWTREEKKDHVQCMSNLKTIALGMLLYNQDYDEWHPPVASGGTRAYGWADLLYPAYVKSRQTFHCPSEKSTRNDNPRKPGYTDYWYNRNFAGKNVIVIDIIDGSVQAVARTIMLGDGDGAYRTSSARYAINALPQSWTTLAGSPAKRHLRGANYAFPDGHVKWLRPHQIMSSTPSDFDVKEEAYSFLLPNK
jgi:prepilin-type processing-associated H-X9-DG protein